MNLSVPAGTHQQQPGPGNSAGTMAGVGGEAILRSGPKTTPAVAPAPAPAAAGATAAAARAAANGPKLLSSLTNLLDQLSEAEESVIVALQHYLRAVGKVAPVAQLFGLAAEQWASENKAEAGAKACTGRRLIRNVFEDVPEGEMQPGHVEESRLEGYREKESQAKRLLLELRDMGARCMEEVRLLKEKNHQLADALQQQPFHLARQPPQSAQAAQPHGQPPLQHHQAPRTSLQTEQAHTPPRKLSSVDPSLAQAPLVARPGVMLGQGVEQEQQLPKKQVTVHWAQPEQLQRPQHARQLPDDFHTAESTDSPMPLLLPHACPLLPSQQPSQQQADQRMEQATQQRGDAPTESHPSTSAGTSCALLEPQVAAAAAAAAAAADLPPGSHVSLLPPPPEAHPSFHTPFLPPTPTPYTLPTLAAPSPAHPQPNVVPAQQQSMFSLGQLMEISKEAQWQWLQSHLPIDFSRGLEVQHVPGSHPTHHKRLFHPGLELLGEVLFQAAWPFSVGAHEVKTHVENKQLVMAFEYPEHPQSLEEHLSAIARRTHLERLEAHLLGGGTALSFMGALAEKGSKKAPYWSGYYIKDLDLYSMLGHLPAIRESVGSLIAALIPDDILGFHFPLLGVTPTRPILYLAGYMGGVGFHIEDDGLQFLNLCLPIPSIGASELPNMVEWYMEETDDTGQRIQRAASGAPKDEATKLHAYNHSKSSLEQGLAQQQPTIKQAPVCSNSWEPLGSGSCADLVVGNLGHAVIAAGGWDRISINWATPSHLLAKVLALRGYKPALVEDRRQAFFQSQQGKWECKQGSPLLLTNCTFAALSAPPGRLRLSPSEMESFVALVLLLLMQARKERQQLAWLLHASSSKKRGPASTPTHTPAAGAAAAGTSAAATAAASPGVPKVAVMQADAPHLTVTAAILGTAQAGASGLNDQQQNACERDLLANPRWADAHQCIAHRKDGVLCDIAAGCVGCSLQWLLIRETQQGQQQERLHGQEAELREGEVRQHEGVHTAEETGRLGQPGQQQEVTEAQGEEIIAERNPRRCRQQEQDQDLDKQGQEQGVEIGQDKLEQGEVERSAPWASSGPQFLAWKRGQRRTHQQALAQPAKKARKQQHGQSLPLRQGAPSHSTQRLSWLQRLLCLPPKAQDPTAQALNSNTYWQAWPDHQCEICGSDLELQRAVLVPPTHPLTALVKPSHTAAEKQTKQPAKRGGKKVHKMRLQEQQQQPSSSQAVPSEQVLATWNEAEEENLDSEHRVRHICLGCLVDRRHDGCRHKWLEPKESAVVLLVRQHSLCFLEERLQVFISSRGNAELLHQAVAKLTHVLA